MKLKTHTAFLIILGTIMFFQNCGRNFQSLSQKLSGLNSEVISNTNQEILSSFAFSTTKPLHSRYSFSESFKWPSSKQGVSEARVSMTSSEFDQRYQVLKSMGSTYRQYNLFWSGLESSNIVSSINPVSCTTGFGMFPATKDELIKLGFHRFRCINLSALSIFDNLLKRDQAAGMQSGVVLWSTPKSYRYSDCQGFIFGGINLKDGCVPRDDAMNDFEDYINLLASRYNGGINGKISHFIVWNENASPDWFDYSPVVDKKEFSSLSVEKRIDKYAEMLKRTHAALFRHQKGSLMYVSTDQLWESGMRPSHYGTKWMLDGLWVRLGLNYSWSVAVHPYGEADKPAVPGIYTFNNLEKVANYQIQKLQELGISDPDSYPQSLLIASEQGWPIKTALGDEGATGREIQVHQLCLAHDKVMSMPQVVAVAHNYFQSVEPAENEVNGKSNQEAFFGLVPYTVPNNLSNLSTLPIGKAFASTMNPKNWKQNDSHYCCQVYGVGCFASKNNSNSNDFKSDVYLICNLDVAEAVRRQEITAEKHYEDYGRKEGRPLACNYKFDESYYRSTYPDVDAAVRNGSLPSGLYHYAVYGRNEKRNPYSNLPNNPYSVATFKSDVYLICNLDVADAVRRQEITAEKHYQSYGLKEGRRLTCSYKFDEFYYRSTYHDVDVAVKNGSLLSGLYHYAVYGRLEKRKPAP